MLNVIELSLIQTHMHYKYRRSGNVPWKKSFQYSLDVTTCDK